MGRKAAVGARTGGREAADLVVVHAAIASISAGKVLRLTATYGIDRSRADASAESRTTVNGCILRHAGRPLQQATIGKSDINNSNVSIGVRNTSATCPAKLMS